MKTILILIATIISLSACNQTNSFAGNTNANFKVWGNCDMCKETIETSLTVNGIASADWNPETKQIKISYDSTKINLDQIQKKIAEAGYDTDAYKGSDEAYNKLHECCQYERKP